MRKRKLILSFLACLLVCSLSLVACGNTANNNEQSQEEVTNNQTEDYSDAKKEYYLDNGYYTIGVDIPAGICEIYATGGVGSILYSADGTIETYSAVDDDLNQSLVSGAYVENEIIDYTLKEGHTIHISGAVRAKVEYSEVHSGCTGREYDTENTITLTSGSHTAGTDFEPGVYTITATEGNGSLYSSNADMLGVNELFGVFDGTETYVPKSVHVTFNEGDVLEVTDVTIELLKVK